MTEASSRPAPGRAAPRVRVLGPIGVEDDDGTVRAPRGIRAQGMIAALALAGGRPVGVETLIDELWGDEAPRDPRAALQSLVSRLRQSTRSDIVTLRPAGYALGLRSDLDEARRAYADAARALTDDRPGDAVAEARAGLGLWRGEPGQELAGGAAAETGRGLVLAAEELRRALERVLRDAADAAGDHETALRLAAPAFDADPTNEDAARATMRAYAGLGRPADALRVYARLRHALTVELGTDPGPDVADLAEVLRGDAAEGAGPGRDGVAINLRVATTPLLGRAGDLVAVEEALRASRLVTILGTGGLGKTRLAQEIGRDAARSVPFVAVIELAGVRSDDDVAVALADALAVAGAPRGRIGDIVPRTLRNQILDHLRGRDGLLILDNCEHVIDGATRWADDILTACDGLRILTTSRAPLRLAAEQVYPLGPLTAGDGDGPAAALFEQRARAARPSVRLPRDVVVRLCEHLDGLPLAIELAAARVRTMTVEEIEGHLGERFALLRSSDRLAPDRHRTLAAIIEWSWNLLADRERELLRRLSMLPDGISADAAVVLGSLGMPCDRWQILDAVDGLVSQSLLQIVDDAGVTRYRMLETVREFGALRLAAAGESAAVLSAIFAWAVDLASRRSDELSTPGQVDAFADLRREQENLLFAYRAAVEMDRPDVVVCVLAALAGLWIVLGSEEQIHGFVEPVTGLVAGWQVPDELVGRCVVALAAVVSDSVFADRRMSLRALARIKRLLRRDVSERPRALGELLLSRSGADAARRIARMSRSADPYLSLLGHFLLAQLAENSGRLAQAVRWSTVVYERATAMGDIAAASSAALFLASCEAEQGRYERVRDWTAVARRGLDALGADEPGRQLDWLDLAATVSLGRIAEAEAMCERLTALPAVRASENYPAIEAARAELDFAAGRAREGLERYRSAVEALESVGLGEMSPWNSILSAAMAVRQATTGEVDAAERTLARLRERLVASWQWFVEYVDYPVAGTVALAMGVLRIVRDDPDGIELIALAERMGSRQDVPALSRETAYRLAEERFAADLVADGRRRAADLRHAQVIERFRALLGEAGTVGLPQR